MHKMNTNNINEMASALQVVSKFIDSEMYMDMIHGRKECSIIDTWLSDLEMRHSSFNFFFDISPTHPRAYHEALELSEIILKGTSGEINYFE